ncbi:MAG: DNA/RNA non-specific endonuclease [Ruminococcus callidus]
MATITLYKDRINGVGSLLDDIISQDSHLNRSDYKKMENHYNKTLDNGQKVTDFNIELKNSPSERPTSIKVDYKVDGVQFKFNNEVKSCIAGD